MDEEKTFRLKIVTPERVFYEGETDFLEMTTSYGDVGIYKMHEPTTFILSPGVLRIHQGEDIRRAALHSGFAEVLKEQVTVLAEAAEWPDEIDVERAKRAKARAEERLQDHTDNIDEMRAELALRRSLTRIKVAK